MKVFLRIFLTLFISNTIATFLGGQDLPLRYPVENTGKDCPQPAFPSVEELSGIEPLTDPLRWSDGSTRSIDFNDWICRRSEIAQEIQHYEIGKKPDRSDSVEASLSKDHILSIKITRNGQSLNLTSHINLPEGEGPFPLLIGIGRATGSLPAEIFQDRKLATLAFDFSQVMAHTQTRGSEPINQLYPELTNIGAYSAWSWGVSRLLDGLEMVSGDLNLDLNYVGITGCSFAGKMALYAGAFDERIALTVVQESGGGGAAAWRVSETLGNVETLGKTNDAWFKQDFKGFANAVTSLPFDQHELLAMIAPRALLVLGNPDYEWLAEESGYISCRAAHEVWKTFGIADRFGYSIVAGHPHCVLPEIQHSDVLAFVDRFLLGDTTVPTNITKHPFENVDHKRWYEWWENGSPSSKTKVRKNKNQDN